MKILIVDDRAEDLCALESVLTSKEYTLIKARSGEEALRYLLTDEPALIIMDVQMPNMSGYQTASLIRGNQRTKEIPIIFMTAEHPEEQFLQIGYSLGAVDYLYKPLDPYILKSKIAVFVELARKTQRLLESERKDRSDQIKQLEQKNLKREQTDQKKYRALIEGLNDGVVWSMNLADRRISFASPSSETLTGFLPEQWMSERDFFIQRLLAEEKTILNKKIESLTESGQGAAFDHQFVTADGSVKWMHTAIRLIEGEDSNSNELQGLSVDITRMKEAEFKLRRSKLKSEALAAASLLLSDIPDPKESIDQIGKCFVPDLTDWFSIHWNDSVSYPVSPTSVSSHDSVHEKISAAGWPTPYWVETAIESKRSYFGATKKESDLSIQSVIAVPLTMRGHVLGAISFAAVREELRFDIEDLMYFEDLGRRIVTAIENRALLEGTKRAVKVRDEFLSIASHELKTPLTSLMLQLQMLRKSSAADQDDRESHGIRFALKQVDSLNDLIEELLDVSRIRSGNLNLKTEHTNLVDLALETLESIRDQIGKSKCNVTILSNDPVLGFWDGLRIKQVLTNLVLNSTKYAPGSQVDIGIEPSRRAGTAGAIIRVKDNGPGIPSVDQESIFDIFERGSTSRKSSGLGLGLFIAKRIVEAHRGQIALKSTPGLGTEFVIDLPSLSSPGTLSSEVSSEFQSANA